MHEKIIWSNTSKLKKEGQKGLNGLRSQKPLKKFEGKWPKKKVLCALIDRRERENFWIEHVKNLWFKKISERFSIDRKLHLIDPEPIELGRFKANF